MFIAGQRWICDTELDLGLGTVLKSDFRTVTIVFLASGQTRTYSKQTAPLRRAAFNIGDRIESHEGWQLKIVRANEHEGLLTYYGHDESGTERSLEEGHLSNNIQLNRPHDRLFSGQVDNNKWFELRMQSIQHQRRLSNSELTGLYDARTSLVPHQLYIAHEVATRFAPRVLLADEVGLGKTIEACMIMQHQLITGRANRVLIVVPEALMHQWLVELMRRFNLTFSIFDKDRCDAIEESTDFDNPFHAEQLILCNIGFLTDNPQRLAQAIEGNWDLVIIDEAHHLKWAEDDPSTAYKAVEALSQKSKGLLLLTATPEQLGKTSHFARLRLLDPQRFHNYQNFLEEESQYQALAAAIKALLDNNKPDDAQLALLGKWLNDADAIESLKNAAEISPDQQQHIIKRLLDRHGTGRVLFRNTRQTVKGFPERIAMPAPLALTDKYKEVYELAAHMEINTPELLVAPERLFHLISQIKAELKPNESTESWWDFDPRVEYLNQLLNNNRAEKFLIICASSNTALELESTIRIKSGKRITAFHEDMSIIERDRAAAYFSDEIDGAQALICSEIGSEGRNFQFAHHLVLFDLPLNPDLLEQRIGRLDRIGQTQDIQIHIPYFEGSSQEVMFQWYMKGLNAFRKTCQAGETIYRQIEPALLEILQDPALDYKNLEELTQNTETLHQEYILTMQQGRDRLLELNSYKGDVALKLQNDITNIDANPMLYEFMERAFDAFGVETEVYRANSYLLKPGPRMPDGVFQNLSEDGTVITFNRDTALSNEDIQFVTWNHPFARDAIEMILGSETGNTSLVAIKTRRFAPGTVLVETMFRAECLFPEAKQAGISVDQVCIHNIMSANDGILNKTQLDSLLADEISNVDKKTAHKAIKSQSDLLKRLMTQANQNADDLLPSIIERNKTDIITRVRHELDRLLALRQVNPSIREEEIEQQENLLKLATARLDASKIRLDAIRIIIAH